MIARSLGLAGAVLASVVTMAQQTIRIDVDDLPPYHPGGSDIYAAGSFNGWNPADPAFRFQKNDSGHYHLSMHLEKGNYEYKITRGGWDKAECLAGGKPTANRSLKVEQDNNFAIDIAEWTDRFPAKPKQSTASRNVSVMSKTFLIPQLKRTRRIWIYLPAGYTKNSRTRYPVLYMQDGQNVFDDATAYSGEWGVDEYLDSAKKKCIVVAIDHGDNKRLNEYNPYDNERFGKGEGDKYVDFLVKTLKPYIDKRYRTQPAKQSTFIAGSSMGGLISLYAVLKYPQVYGGAGIFSPAFWIAGAKIYETIKKKGAGVNSLIYFYGGKKEGDTMVPDMLKAFDALSAVSKSRMTTVIRDEGQHNEANWRREFPLAFEWMVGE